MDEPNLLDATGFRLYLRDWCAWKRTASRSFSLRQFAQRAGFSSHAFLPKILDGERNLTEESIDRVAGALGLDPSRSRLFRIMVLHDQETDEVRRESLYRRLEAARKVKDRRRLGELQAGYYDRWYYPVLRHLAPLDFWKGDFAALGRQLVPPVGAAEVRKALAELERMGLLSRNGDAWQAPDSIVAVERLPASSRNRGRHDILVKAMESLHRFAPDQRSTRCLLLSLSDRGWGEVGEILDEAARRCLEVAARDEAPSRIGQVVIQRFPLTRRLPCA
ncbi:MAG: TIGR02147 family protein [Fibrobacteria bacterium]|nr:TIGR02147 family protein [Fibrobacteria bacterium]